MRRSVFWGRGLAPQKVTKAAVRRAVALFAPEACAYVKPRELEYALPALGAPEIVVLGRSNVGKSSLVGELIGAPSAVRVSKKAGRTRAFRVFGLGDSGGGPAAYLYDMPGYGFAKAARKEGHAWRRQVAEYLQGRRNDVLRRALILVDTRRGVGPDDEDTMALLDEKRVPYTLVLTKADTVSEPELVARAGQALEATGGHTTAIPIVYATSSLEGWGLGDVRCDLAEVVFGGAGGGGGGGGGGDGDGDEGEGEGEDKR